MLSSLFTWKCLRKPRPCPQNTHLRQHEHCINTYQFDMFTWTIMPCARFEKSNIELANFHRHFLLDFIMIFSRSAFRNVGSMKAARVLLDCDTNPWKKNKIVRLLLKTTSHPLELAFERKSRGSVEFLVHNSRISKEQIKTSWGMASRLRRRTYDEISLWWGAYSVWPHAWSRAWGSCHTRPGFVDWISFRATVAGYAETSSWPTTYSTVALTCHRRTFSRRQWTEIFEDTTSSCGNAVFAYSGGKQPTLWDFISRGMNSRWK